MEYQGNPVSGGVAVGRVLRYKPYEPQVRQILLENAGVHEAKTRFDLAKQAAREELEAIREALEKSDPDKAKIFTAHIDILYDVALEEEILDKINDELYDVEWAIESIYAKYIKMLARAKDELIRERVADMQDVRTRLLRNCNGIKECSLSALAEPVIVVAHDLFPSDTASMNRANVLGIVTEIGGTTSHTAIIARGYGIPALLGVENAMTLLADGQEAILDAEAGTLHTNPTHEEKTAATARAAAFAQKRADTEKYAGMQAETPDGTRVEVHLNIGSAAPSELEGTRVADGVGLFRSEFLYMGSDHLPTEEEQYAAYRKVLQTFGKRPVILRTLDIGGDKTLPALPLPPEQNPFLGNRALRLCFSNPEIFHTQLRAALRAGAEGNLWLMFPMVGSMDDWDGAKQAVHKAKAELAAEGVPYGEHIKLGVMIEIPSIALIADRVAQEVDFASIGTNDLCQYCTAVDRLNPTVAKYYQSYHPALFRLMRTVVEAFTQADKPISVCGEMGGDPLAAPVLLGMGMRKLSMNASSVAQIKKVIRGLDMAKAKKLADAVCSMRSAGEIQAYLQQELGGLQ